MKKIYSKVMDKFMQIGDVCLHSLGVVFFASSIVPHSMKVMENVQESIQQPSFANFSFVALRALMVVGDVYLTLHFGNKLLKEAGLKNENNEFTFKTPKFKI